MYGVLATGIILLCFLVLSAGLSVLAGYYAEKGTDPVNAFVHYFGKFGARLARRRKG